MEASAVAARDAATVMLVRDAPGLEVFMMRRSPRSSFVPDAYVFPGGQVDDDDGAAALLARCSGAEPSTFDARLGSDGAIRFYVAALRESFEEAGVLLARDRLGAPFVVSAPQLESDRVRLVHGETDIVSVLDAHGASFDLGTLVPFARWISPMSEQKRFDAWYFVARAPDGHAYVHDDLEMIASDWVRPADMVARARAGEVKVPFPTMQTLLALCEIPTADALLTAVQECWSRPDPWREIEAPGRGQVLDVAPHALAPPRRVSAVPYGFTVVDA